jgi:signal transduction histidine kinase
MKVGDGFGGERIDTLEARPRPLVLDEGLRVPAPKRRLPRPEPLPRAVTARPRPRPIPLPIKPQAQAQATARRSGRRLHSLMRVLEHEMRTPLATSLLHLSAAEAAIGDGHAVESAKAAVAGAARQIRSLSLIVRRAVQIESAQPIDLYPQRVDLVELVNDFVRRLRSTASGVWSRVEVKAGKPVVGDWDPAAVEQILENLLSNALKFGEGRPIVLTVAPERRGARLSVRDEGVGIEARDRERIFARFERGPSARGIAGLGIGLWVVRHLIEAHGGSILVRSRPGKGTVFDVWLPQLALYPVRAPL